MGINGLLPALKPIAKQVHVSKYRGQRAAVDGYSWLHKGAYCCAKELCEGTWTDKYVVYFMSRIQLLRSNGLEPLVVFDGGRLPIKGEEEGARHRARAEAREKAAAHLAAGNVAAAVDCYQRCVDITPAMAKHVIEELKAHGVMFIVAPYEADAQMAYLARRGDVQLVVTEDSDLLAYACPRVLYKLDRTGSGEEMSLADLPNCPGLPLSSFTSDQFLQLCVMAGCDFLAQLPGIGLKKAHGALRKYRSFTKVVKMLRFNGTRVPPEYECRFQMALWAFRHCRVYCPTAKALVHLAPLPPGGIGAADVDVPQALAQLEAAQQTAQLDFLGPDMQADVARGIAEGCLDPMTRQPYDLAEIFAGCRNPPPHIAAQLNPNPSSLNPEPHPAGLRAQRFSSGPCSSGGRGPGPASGGPGAASAAASGGRSGGGRMRVGMSKKHAVPKGQQRLSWGPAAGGAGGPGGGKGSGGPAAAAAAGSGGGGGGGRRKSTLGIAKYFAAAPAAADSGAEAAAAAGPGSGAGAAAAAGPAAAAHNMQNSILQALHALRQQQQQRQQQEQAEKLQLLEHIREHEQQQQQQAPLAAAEDEGPDQASAAAAAPELPPAKRQRLSDELDIAWGSAAAAAAEGSFSAMDGSLAGNAGAAAGAAVAGFSMPGDVNTLPDQEQQLEEAAAAGAAVFGDSDHLAVKQLLQQQQQQQQQQECDNDQQQQQESTAISIDLTRDDSQILFSASGLLPGSGSAGLAADSDAIDAATAAGDLSGGGDCFGSLGSQQQQQQQLMPGSSSDMRGSVGLSSSMQGGSLSSGGIGGSLSMSLGHTGNTQEPPGLFGQQQGLGQQGPGKQGLGGMSVGPFTGVGNDGSFMRGAAVSSLSALFQGVSSQPAAAAGDNNGGLFGPRSRSSCGRPLLQRQQQQQPAQRRSSSRFFPVAAGSFSPTAAGSDEGGEDDGDPLLLQQQQQQHNTRGWLSGDSGSGLGCDDDGGFGAALGLGVGDLGARQLQQSSSGWMPGLPDRYVIDHRQSYYSQQQQQQPAAAWLEGKGMEGAQSDDNDDVVSPPKPHHLALGGSSSQTWKRLQQSLRGLRGTTGGGVHTLGTQPGGGSSQQQGFRGRGGAAGFRSLHSRLRIDGLGAAGDDDGAAGEEGSGLSLGIAPLSPLDGTGTAAATAAAAAAGDYHRDQLQQQQRQQQQQQRDAEEEDAAVAYHQQQQQVVEPGGAGSSGGSSSLGGSSNDENAEPAGAAAGDIHSIAHMRRYARLATKVVNKVQQQQQQQQHDQGPEQQQPLGAAGSAANAGVAGGAPGAAAGAGAKRAGLGLPMLARQLGQHNSSRAGRGKGCRRGKGSRGQQQHRSLAAELGGLKYNPALFVPVRPLAEEDEQVDNLTEAAGQQEDRECSDEDGSIGIDGLEGLGCGDDSLSPPGMGVGIGSAAGLSSRNSAAAALLGRSAGTSRAGLGGAAARPFKAPWLSQSQPAAAAAAAASQGCEGLGAGINSSQASLHEGFGAFGGFACAAGGGGLPQRAGLAGGGVDGGSSRGRKTLGRSWLR